MVRAQQATAHASMPALSSLFRRNAWMFVSFDGEFSSRS
jgi:hypothetical protein